MDYEAAIDYLLSLPDMERKKEGPGARVMSLDTMRRILADLGNPELGRKTIHITGSKGKGSTSAFIASILHEAGLSTALYTSPHLHDYTERICLDLKAVDREQFAKGVATLKPVLERIHASDQGPVSTFGGMTSLFFLLSVWHQTQWQIVEVGMGGTFDGTNVFRRKEVAVITAVSLEHTKILGATPAEIAENKAGIITPGCTAVVAKQSDSEVLRVVQKRCLDVGAEFVDVHERYAAAADGTSFELTGPDAGVRKFSIAMLGSHQIDNALTAVAVADVLKRRGEGLDDPAVARGLNSVALPGRFEVVSLSPYVVVDGAHNAESAAALAQTMAQVKPGHKWTVILGANTDKDVAGILSQLKRVCGAVIATCSQSDRAMSAAELAKLSRECGLDSVEASSSAEALQVATAGGADAPICVTGSLYLVGEARTQMLGTHATWSLRSSAPSTT